MTAIGTAEILLVAIDSFYNPQGAKLLLSYLKQTDATQLRITLTKNATTAIDKTIDVSAQEKGTTKTYLVDLTTDDLTNISNLFQKTNIDSYVDLDNPWKQNVGQVSAGSTLEVKNDSGEDKIVQGLIVASFTTEPSTGTIDVVLVDPDGNEYLIASKNVANTTEAKIEIFGLLPNGWSIRLKNNCDQDAFVEIYLHDNTPGNWATDTGTLSVQELDSAGNVIDQGQATITVKVANMQKKVLEAEAIVLTGIKTTNVTLS